MNRGTHNYRIASALFLAGALMLAVSSALAQNASPAMPQQQPGAAYQDGFNHGIADARSSLPSYGQPGDQWNTDDTRSAYAQGYGAGYAQANSGYAQDTLTNSSEVASSDSKAMANPQTDVADAAQLGYDDGRAQGSKDLSAGNAFRPGDSAMYRNADHGWSAKLGDKDRYRQAYREAYARGYQEGYGNSPTTY